MKVLHIAPNTNGYEVVTLLANRVNKTNSLYAIKKGRKTFYSGGFIITDTPQIRKVLDMLSTDKQYEFVKSMKVDPFVKFYLEED